MKRTLYIQLDTQKCKACWKCIESCSNNVISKINLLWHKHARIKNDDQCTGCLKCVKACDSGALTKI
ncbi:MAG: 4Fe-4S binding protein [Deltaproteobacteria bacterium]|nr:4Fe-4S binding protein [Deltaproteobacteria bacterium]